MQSIRQWYRQRILNNIPLILEHFDERAGIFRAEPGKESLYNTASARWRGSSRTTPPTSSSATPGCWT
mgnify:CR=1 FL=1